ncbi:MAG TPA: CxxxxCH/CxxCH domain-containing protein, partial [Anaeromyxobacteraceae bacterium]|nr:CxxxxCH/CxxCH domain-containing protein [Anaeromyxobacteraceae bacterium]
AKCTTCHGDASATPRATFAGGDAAQLAAPPAVATPAPTGAVTGGGAHVKHVSSATYRSLPLLCTDCHLTKNHQDGQADVAWGALATANATVPTPATGAVALAGWPTTPTCTNWCHGAQLTGGTTPTPNWTATFVVGCTQCHGAPPPVTTATNANHPQNPSCDACHGIFGNAGYDPVAKTLSAAAKATHINGTLNRPTKGCASCHGDITVADGTVVDRLDVRAAPAGDANAVDTRGNKVYTAVGVGAHGKHVLTGAVMSGKACTVCHVLPANGDETHADGLTAWAWSAPATSQGVTPTYTQPSCTNYCHSNAKPLGQASATTVSVSWTATGTVGTCTSCHATSAVSATDLSAKHAKHLTQYGYTCDECHAATMADNSSSVIATPARHVDGNKDVAFSTSALPALLNQSGGSYTSTTSAPNYTCASTYCHSGGVATAAPFSATASAALPWNTGASTCTSCHGWTAAAAPTIGVATGSLFQGSATHAAHVANAAVIGTNYVCGDCHAATVAAGTNSPITSVTNHVNGVKDVSIATRGSFVSTQVYAGSCTATYCHSSGQRSPAYRTIAWTGTLGCNGCHGQSTSTGAPDYANTGKNTAGANSHAKHVAASTDCATCHSTTANSTGTAILAGSALHTNGTINLALDTTKTGATSTSTSGSPTVSATCTNISCHGTNATAVSWGDTSVTCLACHGTTGAEVQDLGATFWANGVTATINTTEWAYSGHGKASGTYDVTGNPAAAFPTAPTAGTSECMYCHDSAVTHKVATNPYRLRGVTDANGVSAAYNTTTSDLANATCLNCHSATANGVDPDGTATAYSKKVATIKTPVSHEGAKHTLGTLGGKFCWDCHEPHGDRANSTTGNIAMIRASVIAVSDGTYGYVGASGQARAVNYTLQTASPPALGKSVETSTAANSQHVGLCQACHAATSDTLLAATAWTKYWNRLGYDDPDGVGGTAPVASAHNSGSTSTPYCISCHPHDKKFAGAGGDCLACHGAAGGAGTTGPNSRRPVSPDFSKTSHHVGSGGTYMGGALTNFDCVVCHAEGTVTAGATGTTTLHQDGKIDLRDADSSTGAYYQYDTNAVRALGTAGANGGNATWISETSGRTDDLVGAATVACNPTGTGCSKGLDRFCLSCHDKNGASQSYLLGDAGATALNPFNDAKITNEYDQQDRTRITDIASRVDVAAPDSASSTTPKDRDSGYAGVTYVRGADTRNDPPEGVFSRHAIRGKSTSVYGGTNAAWDGATQVKGTNGTYWNRANAAWSSKSVLGCADCHTSDGANATNGNAHGSSSEYLLKNGTGTATVGNSTTTVVCAQCHLSSYYVGGTHTGNGGDFQWYVSPTYTGAARIPSASTGGNVYGYACGTCHGGGAASKSGATFPSGSTGAGGYGTIHGTSQVIGTGSGGGVGSRAAYRFMNGNSMRFYDPGDWTTTAARSCYTLSAGDTWGGCIKHSGGTPDGKISGSGSVRPLNY